MPNQKKSRSELKALFASAELSEQARFDLLIDSMVNQVDDEISPGSRNVLRAGTSARPAGAEEAEATSIHDGPLTVKGTLFCGTSELIFSDPEHLHAGEADTVGRAGIQNAQDLGALCISGRVRDSGRKHVRIFDDLDVSGNVSVISSLNVTFSETEDELESGDVVVADLLRSERLVRSSEPHQSTLLGVISQKPGIVLGAPSENERLLALAGRVPVKVNLDGGPIRIGDLLTSSTERGIAQRAHGPGRVLGMALQAFDGSKAELGKVAMLVNPHWWGGDAPSANTPIGTIVPSMAPPERFAAVTGDHPGFDPSRSSWVPGDGRSVAGSKYAEVFGSAVPDLRGVFLRGLNYSDPGLVRTDQYVDDSGAARRAGDLQMDAFQGHAHVHEQGTGPDNPEGTFKGVNGNNQYMHGRVQEPAEWREGVPRFGSETRVRNAAVYYFVRIN